MKEMNCVEMNAKAMNRRYNGFEVCFYDMECNKGLKDKSYTTFGRANKAAMKYAYEGHFCSLVGWFFDNGTIIFEEIACC